MKSFEDLLRESVERHGHLCAGQVLGVRMAMLGCRLAGVEDPTAPEFRKKLIVFVEIDRCATDAIETVTGCRLGKRTLKYKDFGINAATFVNLDTGVAFRVVSTEASRELCRTYAPEESDARRQQLMGYQRMPDEKLFRTEQVKADLSECDMPGPPKRHAVCVHCGQTVRDGKELRNGDQILCRPCGGEGYFHSMEVHLKKGNNGYQYKEISA